MREGRLILKEKTWKLAKPPLLVNYVFSDDDGNEVRPRLGSEALHCAECDTLVLPGALSDALSCFQCGTAIPPEANACPECGWTW
jgi:hypothetical protein